MTDFQEALAVSQCEVDILLSLQDNPDRNGQELIFEFMDKGVPLDRIYLAVEHLINKNYIDVTDDLRIRAMLTQADSPR